MKNIFHYIENNQFNTVYLQDDLPKRFDTLGQANQVFEKIKKLYHKIDIKSLNEGQLEVDFIQIILQHLGYSTLYQDSKSILGKNYEIDFTLFANESLKKRYIEKKQRENTEEVLLFLESKSYKVSIDNNKANETNPHFQLIRYMQSFKINYGFLTNGRYWRFYDITKNMANKVFFQIDLESIILDDNHHSFQYFYHIFKKDNFENINNIQTIITENEQAKIEIENELKELVYGRNSIVKTIGQSIIKKYKDASLETIFEQSSIFTFRLLFIAYLEDKFEDIFFHKHKNYKEYSLKTILSYLEKQDKNKFSAYKKIKELFQLLDEGDDDIDIPLLNGGLFDKKKAHFLTASKLINNEQLLLILQSLLISDKNKNLKRDFKSLSIKHIGNIYESLLDFDFKIVTDDIFYVIYKDGKKEKDGYFDIYDYNKINQKSILYEESYKKGDIIFSNSSNSRKETASYYTPPSFTNFIVKSAIDKRLKYDENILNLKILDNSCGSGHFLVDALDYATEISYKEIEKNQSLKDLIQQEKDKIYKNIIGIDKDEYTIDELILLKRILLKNIIFGVDINPLAIEITRLSLWIDTFIFSTPLSFIEHHIKVGNSLIGSTIDELVSYSKEKDEKYSIFESDIYQKVKNLKLEMEKLAYLKDTTKAEIENSKKIYQDLKPIVKTLNLSLDYITCIKFKNQNIDLIENIQDDSIDDIFNINDNNLIKEIDKIRKKYKFFHYEIEFSDIFYNEKISGFNVIIGNPPWDKTKFDDKDFFSMYRSSYRTLNSKEKEETRENILSYHNVENEYNHKKSFIKDTNEYLKSTYPYNRGSGDSNLFRFFIEKNLSLLAENSNLTYLTPSALIYEDGSINLRKYIFEKFHMDFFYQFENRNKIFDIDSRYKFSTFLIHNAKEKNQFIKTRFMQLDDKILKTENNIINYQIKDIQTLSPEHFMLYELKCKKDLELLKRFHKKYLTLNQSKYIDFRNELHLTADRGLFKIKQEKDDLIVYEGKMIHQFNSKFEKAQYFVNQQELEKKLESIEIYRLIQNIYDQLPESNKNIKKSKEKNILDYLNLSKKEELKQLIQFDKSYPRLAFRMISSATNERTLIFSLLSSNSTYSHSMYAHSPKDYILKNQKVEIRSFPINKVLFINAIFNSLIIDYISRFIIDINATKTYLIRLPVPDLTEEQLKQNQYQTLILNSLKLTLSYNSTDFLDLQKQFQINPKDIPKTEKQKDMLKIQNDQIIAKMYDISSEELQHITSADYFKVFNEKNPSYIKTLIQTYENILK